MGFIDGYILELGTATESLTTAVLYKTLYAKYKQDFGSEGSGEFVASLAAAVTNMVLDHEPGKEKGAEFLRANNSLVLDNARKLSSDPQLCTLLSGAAYIMSYARFVSMGGKTGFLVNPFLGFVRALSKSYAAEGTEAMDAYMIWRGYHDALRDQRDAVNPLLNLHNLGLFVPLAHSPNEKAYYEAVVRGARELGLVK
jgi:hypothetical protein